MPTVAESGYPGFDVHSWYGVVAPSGAPPGIVERLHCQLAAIVDLPDVRERLAALGMEPSLAGPEGLAAQMREDIARWAPVVHAPGLRIDN